MVSSAYDPRSFEARVLAALRKLGLRPGPWLVAASGGPDSAALAAALSRLGGRLGGQLQIVHVDHQMRPSSGEDAAVARQLAARLGAPFHLERVEVRSGDGPEAGARRARYAALGRLAGQLGAVPVAVGHTRTDQAETVLLRLLRGAGARGLAAMAPARVLCDGVLLVRPLLAFPREEVRRYAAALQLPTITDPTNQDARFQRNALRRLWADLLALSPRLEERLAQLADLCRDDERALDDLAAAAVESLGPASGGVRAEALAALPAAVARRVVRRLVREVEPEAQLAAAHVDRVLSLLARRSPGAVHVAGDLQASVRHGRLAVQRRERPAAAPPFCRTIPGEGRWPCPEAGLVLAVSRAPVEVERGRDVLYLPLDGTDFPLTLRSRRAGDRFHPKGAPGSRKLKRFLIDERVPRPRRDRLALLCAGAEILWVAGIRPAERACCPPPGELAWRLCAEPLEVATAAQ